MKHLTEYPSKILAQLFAVLDEGHSVKLVKTKKEEIFLVINDTYNVNPEFFYKFPASLDGFDKWLANILFDIRENIREKKD